MVSEEADSTDVVVKGCLVGGYRGVICGWVGWVSKTTEYVSVTVEFVSANMACVRLDVGFV